MPKSLCSLRLDTPFRFVVIRGCNRAECLVVDLAPTAGALQRALTHFRARVDAGLLWQVSCHFIQRLIAQLGAVQC